MELKNIDIEVWIKETFPRNCPVVNLDNAVHEYNNTLLFKLVEPSGKYSKVTIQSTLTIARKWFKFKGVLSFQISPLLPCGSFRISYTIGLENKPKLRAYK